MIAAISQNLIIGNEGKLPRHYPEDLKRFKKITLGSTVIMGRKTFESIGRPLPNRHNIVISKTIKPAGVETFENPTLALEKIISEKGEDHNIFIIGGESIYTHFLPEAERLYMTEVHKTIKGDTSFPAYKKAFHEVEREAFEEYDFVLYHNKKIT